MTKTNSSTNKIKRFSKIILEKKKQIKNCSRFYQKILKSIEIKKYCAYEIIREQNNLKIKPTKYFNYFGEEN